MREEGAASFERARGHSAQPRWRFCPPSPGLPGQQVHVFGIPLNSRHPWETKYPRSFSRDVSFLLKTFLECRLLQPCHPDASPPAPSSQRPPSTPTSKYARLMASAFSPFQAVPTSKVTFASVSTYLSPAWPSSDPTGAFLDHSRPQALSPL